MLHAALNIEMEGNGLSKNYAISLPCLMEICLQKEIIVSIFECYNIFF